MFKANKGDGTSGQHILIQTQLFAMEEDNERLTANKETAVTRRHRNKEFMFDLQRVITLSAW